jgi:predicted nucleic acid-binding protein
LNLPTAYDAQYLAVAQRYECDFWTADEHLFNVATGSVPRTFWLGNMALGGTDEATE